MMGHFAQVTADKYGFSREEMDAFATESATRAQRAVADGSFADEIAPVTIKSRRGETVDRQDETPGRSASRRSRQLRPAFAKDGTVTAATSSSISDGAAAVVMMTRSGGRETRPDSRSRRSSRIQRLRRNRRGLQQPRSTRCKKLHETQGWTPDDVDLYEINEAFAVVTMAAMKDVGIGHDKVNVNGGACALGHPIGATGCRISVTLLHELACPWADARHRDAMHRRWRGYRCGLRNSLGRNSMKLSEAKAVITGGASGLGFASANA